VGHPVRGRALLRGTLVIDLHDAIPVNIYAALKFSIKHGSLKMFCVYIRV
jgi:hypothetical protein